MFQCGTGKEIKTVGYLRRFVNSAASLHCPRHNCGIKLGTMSELHKAQNGWLACSHSRRKIVISPVYANNLIRLLDRNQFSQQNRFTFTI